MRPLLKIMTSSAWLILWVTAAAQSANAQKSYPPVDEAWDATDYRALVQRVETDGLALPTLSGAETKPVFERMVSSDNIPLRMGLNKDLAITVRYQKLRPLLQPLQQLIVFYSNEAQNGKPYATELARLKVYESKAAGILLDIGEPFLATLVNDKRYQTHVALFDQMKSEARQIYHKLINSIADTKLYSRSDIVELIRGAIKELPYYHPILIEQDRSDLTRALAEQISATEDQELKKALTELSEAIEHRRIPA